MEESGTARGLMLTCCQGQCGAYATTFATWETIGGRTVGVICPQHFNALCAAGVAHAATSFAGDNDALIDVLLGDVLPG